MIALALAGAAVLPALAQERPESILPPGFNEQTPPPAATPAPTPAPGQQAAPVRRPVEGEPVDLSGVLGNNVADALPLPPPDPALLAQYELPAYARRSLDRVGLVGPGEGGMAANAFAGANGRYLESLMAQLDAPVPSRWLSIALRRALASRIETPAGVNGADFAAERAWLLVRMGESVVARALVEAVDTDNYTPKMRDAALQAALATGDPAMLCPITADALKISREGAWVAIDSLCKVLSGQPGASSGIAALRRSRGRDVDVLLADKLVGMAGKRGAVTIEWAGVSQLSAWRYGLAVATGEKIPDELFATVSPRVQFWRAQAPMWTPRERAGSADFAAAQGVLSSAALVDLYGEIEATEDLASAESAIARDLRTAYVDADRARRLAVMTQLWDEPTGARARYARLILTARAAAELPPARDDARERLIASMLSAGLASPALAWWSTVDRGSEGWAMLALADESMDRRYSRADVRSYRGGTAGALAHKRQMFFAALAGLGRIDEGTVQTLAGDLSVDLGRVDAWTRAIDRAAMANQPGTVLLLAALGMQTPNWHGVAPEYFYHIIAAMHRTGLDGEARMMAAEALTRL
ncbi:MAG: hypothetical protein K2Y03_06115 [Sphingomonas sp.]|nr:hypothetical protein [Sphingomonas sp.]